MTAVITVAKTKQGFTQIGNNLLIADTVNGSKTSAAMVLVYSYVAALENTGNTVAPTVETLGKVARLSDRRTRELLSKMREIGMLEITQRQHRPSILKTVPLEVVETAVTEGEDQNAASRPTRKSKPELSIVQDQEQPNNDYSDNSGDPVQHDDLDSEQPDVMPVVIDTTESTEPQTEGETVDSILPVDDCDHDDSDAVTAAEPDQLDQQIAAAELHGFKYDLAEIMRHCQGSRAKAAVRLQGEIGVFHRQRILEAQGAAQASDLASNDDGYDDGYSIEDDWNPEDGDAY